MVTGWRAETVAPDRRGGRLGLLLEGTGRAERDDRAARREGRGEQRRADDRARPTAAAWPLGGHGRGRGRRRGLVPAFLRGLVGLARPGGALGPIGPGLGRGGVAAGLAGGRWQRVALRLVRRVVRLVGVGVLRITHGVVMISGSGAVPRPLGGCLSPGGLWWSRVPLAGEPTSRRSVKFPECCSRPRRGRAPRIRAPRPRSTAIRPPCRARPRPAVQRASRRSSADRAGGSR